MNAWLQARSGAEILWMMQASFALDALLLLLCSIFCGIVYCRNHERNRLTLVMSFATFCWTLRSMAAWYALTVWTGDAEVTGAAWRAASMWAGRLAGNCGTLVLSAYLGLPRWGQRRYKGVT